VLPPPASRGWLRHLRPIKTAHENYNVRGHSVYLTQSAAGFAVQRRNCYSADGQNSDFLRDAGNIFIGCSLRARESENCNMRNLKLTLSYDGTDFSGWQVQPETATIQATLASAIGRITGEKVLPQGSGRTDAGVHALAQVVTFVTESSVPAANFQKALNDILPSSVRVLQVEEAGADFHARHSAKAKTYRYRIYREAICPPFLARYLWHYPYPLEEGAMASAAAFVIGKHDFTSFAAVDPERGRDDELVSNVPPSNVRQIFSSCWARVDEEFVYTVRGSGFLHHMVRNLVGTFVLVGKGSLKPGDVARILKTKNRSQAGPTAPANGLYLVSVEY
jgi:tRNA pseudouridine38-40 synthase